MILTNEPGYYKTNEYGIRIENIMAVKQITEGWLGFDNLTMVPYCKELIVKEMLSGDHLKLIDEYY